MCGKILLGGFDPECVGKLETFFKKLRDGLESWHPSCIPPLDGHDFKNGFVMCYANNLEKYADSFHQALPGDMPKDMCERRIFEVKSRALRDFAVGKLRCFSGMTADDLPIMNERACDLLVGELHGKMRDEWDETLNRIFNDNLVGRICCYPFRLVSEEGRITAYGMTADYSLGGLCTTTMEYMASPAFMLARNFINGDPKNIRLMIETFVECAFPEMDSAHLANHNQS